MDFLKNVSAKTWGIVAAVAGVVFLLFKQRQTTELQAQLESAEFTKNDAVLANKQENVEEAIAAQRAAAEEERKKKLTHEELAKELDSI